MRRLAFVLAVLLCIPTIVRAGEAEATEDYKAIEEWVATQSPTTAEEKKKLRADLTKRFRDFLAKHTEGGRPTHAVRARLADILTGDGKLDEAIGLYEKVLASGDAELAKDARHRLVGALIVKKDLKAARARLDAFLKDSPDDEKLKQVDEHLRQLEIGEKGLTVGTPPPAIKAKTFDGGEVSLEALKGKVVLIDFWATWCPPCRKELPALRKLYGEVHQKGFEIVGVDIHEKDLAAFKKFLADEKVVWPQVLEDAKAIARTYGVKTLPQTVLVGKDGNILAVGLRQDALLKSIRAAVDGKPLPAVPKPVEKKDD